MRQNYAERFDEFQTTAVDCIVSDYRKSPGGRFLLVVPTGGGKTITAVKSVNALFQAGVYDASKHRVLWVAHRDYLLKQASDAFDNFEVWYPNAPSFSERVDFVMLSEAAAHLRNTDDISLVIIDEAHHAAASSYLPLFEKGGVGVLGLTATPSRYDGKPLDFERESYSIGFPDLVDLGIVLRPEVRTVDTGQEFDIRGFSDSDLQKLDDEKRNATIINELLANHHDYAKAVVYVGSVSHAEHLFRAMQESDLRHRYDSISCITGGSNSRGLSRDDFLEQEQQIARSIVVNVDVLTEGYDDPTVNTVVMARPTNSKLVYMQAMGRAIRHDPNNDPKKAFVVEVVDNLPNIRYRIDNRWLYADISDALEPAVEDRSFYSDNDLIRLLQTIYDEYNVLVPDRHFPTFQEKDRYGLLLFKLYTGDGECRHIPLLISRDNRVKVNNFFNYLSERLPYFIHNNINPHSAFRLVDVSGLAVLNHGKNQRRVFEAMQNSVSMDGPIAAMSPWITYFVFHHRQNINQLSGEVKAFLEDMVNGDQIREMLLRSEFPKGAMLVRFPLPLCSFIGRILHSNELQQLESVIFQLESLKTTHATQDHRVELFDLLNRQQLPIEAGLMDSLKTIVREHIRYSTPLD